MSRLSDETRDDILEAIREIEEIVCYLEGSDEDEKAVDVALEKLRDAVEKF